MGRTIELLSPTLELLMKLRGLNSTELARRSGMSKSQVSRYLTGKTVPQLPQLDRLLDALRVDLAVFGETQVVLGRLRSDLDTEDPEQRHLLIAAAFHSEQEGLVPEAVRSELEEISRRVIRIAGLVRPGGPTPPAAGGGED